MEKHKDRRITKTKHLLCESLLSLLDSTPMNQITVKELCDKADINRNTFYYHFECIDDLLFEIIHNFKQQILSLFSSVTDTHQYALELCHLYKQNAHLILVLLNGNVNVSFIYQLLDLNYIPTYNALSQKHSNETLISLMSTYIQVSTFTIISEWLKSGYSISEEEIATILCQIWNSDFVY